MAGNYDKVSFTLDTKALPTEELEGNLGGETDTYEDPVVTFEVVTRLEDFVIDFVEKIYVDVLLNDPSEHSSIINHAEHILNDITLELEHLSSSLLEIMSSVVQDLIYIKNQPVSSTDDGVSLLEEFSHETISNQHGELSMEGRLRKLSQFVMRMRQCTENFAVDNLGAAKASGSGSQKKGTGIFYAKECEECRNHEIEEIQTCSRISDNQSNPNVSVVLQPEEILRNSISHLASANSSKTQKLEENSYQEIGGRISDHDIPEHK